MRKTDTRKARKNVDKNFFPGWTRKSLTFTIDDGNVKYDSRFLHILKPYGILGTFNLCSHLTSYLTPDGYREFYRGYEIANHMKYHPTAIPDTDKVTYADELFDPMTSPESPDGELILVPTGTEGLYKFRRSGAKAARPGGWGSKSDNESYKRFIDEGRRELEEIFGKGSVTSFVWPCEEQSHNAEILRYVKGLAEYYAVRKTGEVLDSTGFDMPADRRAWSYNATAKTLLSLMAKYESYPDDGKLKFFSFGVHSGDFETFDKWGDLEEFAKLYGNRPESYYYATVRDIFAYEDAVACLAETENYLFNPTEKPIYLKVEGEKIVLLPNSGIEL